jgi:RHS repeat-associated protein
VFNGNNQINDGAYDLAGNRTNVNGNTVAYDAENRQVTVTEPASLGGGTETYAYDGMGQRVFKSGPGGTTVYVYDALGQLAAEYSTAINSSPCATCYLTWDHLGTPRMVTDQNGNVVARHDYLLFGEEVPGGSPGRTSEFGANDGIATKFTGQYRDSETGVDYFHARYFGSAQGRFNSPDPMNAGADLTDPQTWNGYAYVRNNPLNAVDPSGACDVFAAGITMYPGEYSTVSEFAANKIAVFPYAGGGLVSGVVQAGTEGGDVSGTVLAIRAAISQSAPSEQVNLFGFSDGAQAINLALGQLNSDELARVGNVTYMMPGSNPFGGNLASGNGTTTYIKGTGLDRIVPSARPGDGTYNLIQSSCSHDASCAIKAYSQLLSNLSGSPCKTPAVITPNGINVSKGTATSTITYGPIVTGGGSSGLNSGGWFFQPNSSPGENGDAGGLIGGGWIWMSSPARQPMQVK